MTIRDYSVGDQVTIRDWDDMVAEYGLDSSGDIHGPSLHWMFTSHMKRICGNTYTIRKIDRCIRLDDESFHWGFEPWMFRQDDEDSAEVEISDEALMSLILG